MEQERMKKMKKEEEEEEEGTPFQVISDFKKEKEKREKSKKSSFLPLNVDTRSKMTPSQEIKNERGKTKGEPFPFSGTVEVKDVSADFNGSVPTLSLSHHPGGKVRVVVRGKKQT